MTLYVIRRFLNYLILTCVATTFAYVAASTFLNPAKKYQGRNPPVPEDSIANLMRGYGVYHGDPVALRTWNWVQNIFTAPFEQKLGKALTNNWVITDMLGTPGNALNPFDIAWLGRSGISLRLLLIGALLGALLGVILGVWGAVRQYKASDQIISYASFILFSTPTFVGGLMLMILATEFNRLVGHQVLRFSGAYTPGYEGFGEFLDLLNHLLLPTIALMLFGAASYSRYMRAVMLDVLGSDFIRTARAKGATRNRALIKHGVRVALIPMSTYFAYQFGTLVAGSTFLEIIFSWEGMGKYGITAVQTSDINAMAGVVCFTSVLVLFSSTLSEVLYAALDPRVRM
ncbi:ABC transporter permease [Brachybacterium sp. J144]|uniref:ABC transporter permease n=1 Tax=Brachybacterium sp. J144 TaxID=3116487 RepID=UPI002E790914|nr:ABC transporter permease [Brachybacterium sp. J144]MEE1651637.1 ABC transporter permease [Brachybacterium sp. J144]